jgi:alpha-tubulin suppressor-like RCC1 family protein
MAITDSGDVYTWGAGGSGRLGHGNIETCLAPKKIKENWQTKLADNDA